MLLHTTGTLVYCGNAISTEAFELATNDKLLCKCFLIRQKLAMRILTSRILTSSSDLGCIDWGQYSSRRISSMVIIL